MGDKENLNGLGRTITSSTHNREAKDRLEALHLFGLLSRESWETMSMRFVEWGLVLMAFAVDKEEDTGVKKDTAEFIEVYRQREADFSLVDEAFLSMDPEKLKPLLEPLPEKYQPLLQRVAEFSEKKRKEEQERTLATLVALRAAFPDVSFPDMESPDCGSCAEEVRRICPLPAAVEWREKHPTS